MHLIDKSIDEYGSDEALTFNLFLPKDEMPEAFRCGNVLVLHSVKVRENTPILIPNHCIFH